MLSHLTPICSGFARKLLCTIALVLYANPAAAHVKWFCTYDVAAPPQPIRLVLNGEFRNLALLTIAVLLVAGLLDRTPLGLAMLRSLDRATWFLRDKTDVLVRAVLGGFFVALWMNGGIILTPELKTTVAWVPWLQLAIAVSMIWRQTLVLGALGMATLYVYAIDQYCLFHLMDYPIFLGLAAYLALSAVRAAPFGLRPLDVLRYATAITLMWASVEKWAYPQWTFPLLATHPEMTFGFTPEFYMRAAGLVEFALAFTLACGPLMRRTSAIILTAMFVSAVFEFGKIDALGHSAIIVVLLAILADNELPAPRRSLAMAPAYFCASLAVTVLAYYGVHAAFFRAAIG
ncbi:MAG: hypothetical protein JO143_09470 [Acetobacteraceae bacterium]|nr:hypothetical protein [Acetobacteraceae bacterium]